MIKRSMLVPVLVLIAGLAFSWQYEGQIVGFSAGDQLGSSVAEIDFNGDGHNDLVIGASAADLAGTSSGAVYVVLGGPDGDLAPDMTLVGAAGSFFGMSVANIGDINSDGYDDLAVGAPFYDSPAASAGAVYVYLCGPAADTSVDLLLTGEAAGDYFGIALCGLGDFNADSHDDFAVGAYRADWGSYANSGKVYVFHGGPALDSVADRVLVGDGGGERFGYALTAADFDQSGAPSLAVGAYSYDSQDLNVGRVYVFGGGADYDTLPDHRLTGSAAGEKYGWSLAAGLVDADSFPDLVMGTDGYTVGGWATGRVYLYRGGDPFDTTLDGTFTLGRMEDDYLGYTVAAGFDVDGDGTGEIIAGAPGNDDGAADGGAALLLGYSGGSLIADTTFLGIDASAGLGGAVSFWSGFGQSHETAVVFGAMGYDSFRGMVAIYSIADSLSNQPPQVSYSGATRVTFGDSLVLLVTGVDPDGTTPELLAYGLPTGAEFVDSGNGEGSFCWLTSDESIGLHMVVFVASDGDLADSVQVSLIVNDTASCCVGMRGNVNNDIDDDVNISDMTYLISYLFSGGPPPFCFEEADVNADLELNISDMTYLISYLFSGGPFPQPCD